MADIKVLNKPDYELTLSHEEKGALQQLLGEVPRNTQVEKFGVSISGAHLNEELYFKLNDCNP